MEKLSFGGTVVPSCMLGSGIRGTFTADVISLIGEVPLLSSEDPFIFSL